MLILTVTYTRPDTNIRFFQPADVVPGWHALLDSYKQSGKLISNEIRLDGQVVPEQVEGNGARELEIVGTWRSVADNMEFLGEEAVSAAREARLAYCSQHNIGVVFTRQVIVDQYDTEEPTA